MKSFVNMVKTQFKKSIWIIRSDNGLEFFGQEMQSIYLKGILHQHSCVSTTQQNGVVERKHRHLLEIAQALCHAPKIKTGVIREIRAN